MSIVNELLNNQDSLYIQDIVSNQPIPGKEIVTYERSYPLIRITDLKLKDKIVTLFYFTILGYTQEINLEFSNNTVAKEKFELIKSTLEKQVTPIIQGKARQIIDDLTKDGKILSTKLKPDLYTALVMWSAKDGSYSYVEYPQRNEYEAALVVQTIAKELLMNYSPELNEYLERKYYSNERIQSLSDNLLQMLQPVEELGEFAKLNDLRIRWKFKNNKSNIISYNTMTERDLVFNKLNATLKFNG